MQCSRWLISLNKECVSMFTATIAMQRANDISQRQRLAVANAQVAATMSNNTTGMHKFLQIS